MKFLIINGPNLNLWASGSRGFTVRIPTRFSATACATFAAAHGSTAECFQSNHEGAVIDAIHAAEGSYDAIVMNQGLHPLQLRHSGRTQGRAVPLRGGPYLQCPPAGGIPP